jgi:O-antigen/teichoic acid export membrane protein
MSIKNNTAINIMGAVLPMVLMLITVPLYLKILGDVRYGVLALVWLVLGYLSFMEMGLGKATANQIAKAHAAPARERSEIFWTAIAVNAVLGLIAAFILWLAGDYIIGNVIKIPDNFRAEALASLPWLIATFPLALISSVLNGALEGANKFLLLNSLQVFGNILFQFGPLLVAYWYDPSLEYVIPAAVIARVIANIFLTYACHVHVSNRAVLLVSRSKARSLLSFGGWVGLSSFVTPALESIDRFIIGATIGAKAVTYYTIAYQLAGKLRVIPSALSRALLPRLSTPSDDRHLLAIHSLQALTVLLTPVTIIIILLLTPFLKIWIGPDIAAKVNTISHLFLLGIWLNSIGHVPATLLIGLGKPSTVARIHVTEVLPFIALVYWGAASFGVIGVVLVWVIRTIIDTAILCHFAEIAYAATRACLTPVLLIICTLLLSHFSDHSIIDPLYKLIGGPIIFGLSIWLARAELKLISSQLPSRMMKSRFFRKII